MRILFLALDINLASLTGDTIHVKELVKSLSRLGNEVFLVVPGGNDVQAERERLERFGNVKVHINNNRNLLNTIKFCKRIIETRNPEVIYERRFSAKVGAALSFFSKVPLVIEVNGLIEEEIEITDGSKKTPTIISVTKKNMRKRFFKRATRIVAVTEGIRKGLARQYNIQPRIIDVVPNGADVDRFRPLDQDSCRSELGLVAGSSSASSSRGRGSITS
jgi:glycosyltransferase involved in cell wall biosynthesis